MHTILTYYIVRMIWGPSARDNKQIMTTATPNIGPRESPKKTGDINAVARRGTAKAWVEAIKEKKIKKGKRRRKRRTMTAIKQYNQD